MRKVNLPHEKNAVANVFRIPKRPKKTYICQMQHVPSTLKNALDKRKLGNMFRTLTIAHGQIDFSSNDYLGFAQNETLFSKTFQFMLKNNVAQNGSTGSRLLTGNHPLYPKLEEWLATFHNAEAALVFNSGYDANIGFFSCVPQKDDLVFYDELIHASIRDGITLGRSKGYKFAHNDLEDLKEKLERTINSGDTIANPAVYIVTESVFSMDGDSPDLKPLADFCSKKGYFLVIDEAHATGIIGKNGEGMVQELALERQVFARIITFGKAMGTHGAAILGPQLLKDYLVNFARSFIYTTAMPPQTLAAIWSSYLFLSEEEGRLARERLNENIKYFKETLVKLGLEKNFIPSTTAIQSCLVPETKKVKNLSEKLMKNGFSVKPILSPTVPTGKERLRCCLHSTNSKEEIGLLLKLMKDLL